jgi:hypothetical protein
MKLLTMADDWGLFTTTWQHVLPPSRPDVWQLAIIKKKLDKIAAPKAAVLGATIEFRDLLFELNISDVCIFENNAEFFRSVSQYRKYANVEKIIWGDWLDTLPAYENEFDVILSDLTSGNIPYKNRSYFYQIIAKGLKPGGIFIDRILIKPIPFIPIEKLVDKYSDTVINKSTVNNFNCEVVFCSSLIGNNSNTVDTSACYEYLLSLEIPRIAEFVKECYLITPPDCIWWYSLDWGNEKAIYEDSLKIVSEYDEPPTSAYFKRAKLFISEGR